MGRISFESGTYSATGGATALNKVRVHVCVYPSQSRGLAPSSGPGRWSQAHGSLMFIAWTLFPLGILLARFTRHVEPSAGPNARWFLLHRITQVRSLCVP